MNELQKTGEMPMERVPSPLEMMNSMIRDGKITAESVSVMRELRELDKDMRRDNAEAAFNQAYARLSMKLRTVRADVPVYDNNGKLMYMFAPYEDIWKQVQEPMLSEGFAVRYSQDIDDKGRVTTTCHLMHEGGHTASNKYTVRPGEPLRGMTVTKCDIGAATSAQREALCDALNIIRTSREETDARMEGDAVHPDQAEHLRQRVQETKADEKKFLQYAGAKTFDEIPAARYQQLLDMLEARERKAAGK